MVGMTSRRSYQCGVWQGYDARARERGGGVGVGDEK